MGVMTKLVMRNSELKKSKEQHAEKGRKITLNITHNGSSGILIPSQKLNIGDIRANIGLKEEIMI